MQEYELPLSECLVNGLPPDNHLPPNAPYATVMRNLRPGLIDQAPELISNPTRNSQDWPFPKVVRDERVTLLLTRTGISTVTEGSPSWTVASGFTLKSSFNQSTTVTLAGGTKWDFCAFEDGHWFATNGVDFAFKLTTYGDVLRGYFDASTTPIVINTLCRHGERLLMGGISGGTWFTDSRFAELFRKWRMKQRNFMHSSMTWDTKWVVWGERRGGATDGPFFLMMVALGLFGTTAFDKFKTEIEQAVEDGEIGFASVKDVGAPRAMRPLEGSVRVYGASSICTLSETEGSGYSVSYAHGVGLRNFAISGDKTEHAWIDPSGDLHHTRHGNLNFRWIFQATPSATTWDTPVMSFDDLRKEHWISNGTTTYLLSPDGKMSGPHTFVPTGLIRSGSLLVGVTQYNAGSGAETIVGSAIPTATTWTAEFQSHPFCMNYRGSKRIQTVEATYENLTTPLADISARTGASGAYTSMGTTPFNSDGAAYVRRSGNDFKLTVKGTVSAGADYAINGVRCRYQPESRQHRRGTSVPSEQA